MNIQEINQQLFELASNSTEPFYNKLIPGGKLSIGVRVPVLRKLAKEIAKDDYKYFMENCPDDYLEHELLQAFVIGYAKDDIETILQYADKFIPKIHDWCVNDAFCQTFSVARKNRKRVFEWLQKYIESDKEYDQRVVAVLLMSHFLTDDYYEKIYPIMDKLDNPAYYTKMGVAWCVATAYAKYPEATMQYLKDNKLDDWTYNKSIQKMIESFRVPDEDKKILRAMKRKAK